jgi:lipopolysaccharide assembly outer membrane protein LptD (OstA)
MPLVPIRSVCRLVAPAVCALALVAAAATGAAAQVVPGWNTKQFTLERIDGCKVILTREVEIEGEKGSANEGQKFFADNVELNTCTGDLTASGNVVFSTIDSRIAADSVVFNTRTKLGTFTTASGIASLGDRGEQDRSMFGTMEPDVYFYGERIDKIDVDKYKIHRGAFTTCVQPTPRWEIASGSAIVNLHDYALLNNAPPDSSSPPTGGPRSADSRSATPFSGRSAAARMRRCSTTGSCRAARAPAPSTATSPRRNQPGTSASIA